MTPYGKEICSNSELSLTLSRSYPNMFSNNKLPLNVYKSMRYQNGFFTVYWHFGYPSKMIYPLLPTLETERYWGDSHWCEKDGYLIYKTNAITINSETDKFPEEILRLENIFRREKYLRCVSDLLYNLRIN
jgi:hypothetical protein